MFKKWLVALTLVASIVFPSLAFAAGESDFDPTAAGSVSGFMMKVQQDFNRELIGSMTKDLLDNPVVGWNAGGLVKVIFVVCFIIALAQALTQRTPEGMVQEMAKLAFWSWLVMALLGGPTYQRFSFLNTGDSNYSSTVKSLDLDIFNFVAYQMDQSADSLFAAAGPQKLMQSSIQNKNLTENLMNARKYCQAGPAGSVCMQAYMKETPVDPASVTAGAKDKGPEASNSFGLGPIISFVNTIYGLFSDLTLLAFYVFSWLVDLIRAAMNMFILISFGIITGVSFFLMKFIFPFAVLPKYRGQVMKAVKVPLSATMYGFATSLIVYISAVGYSAMNQAAIRVIFKAVASGNSASLAVAIPIIQTSVFTGMLMFALLQVFAITKVPQLCRNLLDLSFDSFVNFAKEVMATATSVVTTVAGAALTGGASLAMGGAGGLLGKAAGGLSGGISAIGSKLGFGGGAAAPGALFKGGGMPGAGGAGSAGKASPVSSLGGLQTQAAEDSARSTITSTSAAAQASARDSVFPDKKIPDPKKGGSGITEDEDGNLISEKGSKKSAAKKLLEKSREKSGLTKFMSAGLNAGMEKDGEFADMIGGGIGALAESAGGSISNLAERAADPKAYAEKKQAIAAARQELGMEPEADGVLFGKDTQLSRAMGKTQMYKEYQKGHASTSAASHAAVSGAIDKVHGAYNNTMLKDGSQRVETIKANLAAAAPKPQASAMSAEQSQTMETIKNTIASGESLSPQLVQQAAMLQNNFDLGKEDDNLVQKELIARTKESMDRIKQNKATEDDYSLTYRAQNSGFSDDILKRRASALTGENESFQKYSAAQDQINESMRKDMGNKKTDISSASGSKLLSQMKDRVESGMMSRDDFRESVGTKAVEFTKDQKARRQEVVNHNIDKEIRQQEKADKNLEKRWENNRMAQDLAFGVAAEDEGGSGDGYVFAETRFGNVDDTVFEKNGQAQTEFTEEDKRLIDKLSLQVSEYEQSLASIENGTPEFQKTQKPRKKVLVSKIKRLNQIIEKYKKDTGGEQ